ncbi:MAG TPA: polysaccharide biosynthesis protein [Clostridiales bacterium]|nr:polysaccharide biosynthesis protein [Clostridiales bacterium]
MKLCKYRRLVVFLMDVIIIFCVSTALFYLLPEYGGAWRLPSGTFYLNVLLFILCWSVFQWLFKTYDSLWRYARGKEYLGLMLGGLIAYLVFLLAEQLLFGRNVFTSFTLAIFSVSVLGMVLMRMCYRQYRKGSNHSNASDKIPLAIIGAGDAGVKLLEDLQNNKSSLYQAKYFIDDSREKVGKRIHNVDIKGPIAELQQLLTEFPVKVVVISIPGLPIQKRKLILEVCIPMNCQVRILPDTAAILRGKEQNLWNSVRDIRIEELLGREQVSLAGKELNEFLDGKTVMVTGGGGSIGSELCRQIAKAKISKLVIVDNYENNAYEIQQELWRSYGNDLEIKVEIASVRDKEKVDLLFERHRPDIIFHAAAHKHVPLMEDCPEEAILNNVFGTYHLVLAADKYGTDKFVLISTDKAVNPTNIMGASKRFCEMLLQSMKGRSKTEYVAVRFGNVLGSNGSVIPLFQKQIAQGGPVTITDKRIVRFFMTISEAVQLVLQAGAMANQSEIYVLDMGEPVKILELAENLIRLSGRLPYTEIPIIETGLRPGEKLYEELLTNKEALIATSNHKIFIEKQSSISGEEIEEKLNILTQALETKSYSHMIAAMKRVVPTYKDPEEVNNLIDP